MKKYKHLFFDLDRTLWDFEQNAEDTLLDIFRQEKLKEKGIPSFDLFLQTYHQINHHLWEEYKTNDITKDYLKTERFYRTLKHYNIVDYALAERMGADYLTISPTKKKLFPYSLEILDYLKGKYALHIITNGFSEVQYDKLANAGLQPYFGQVITSEAAGRKKPDSGIFDFALEKAHARREESLMIGDDPETDIKGARNAGLDQVYVNFRQSKNGVEATYEVHTLDALEQLL